MEAFQNIFIPPLQNFDLLSSLKSGIASLQTAGPTDVVDILIVAYIIYRMMKLLKDTSAARLAKGILVLALVMLLACLAGCGGNNSGANTSNNGSGDTQSSGDTSGEAGTIGSPDAPVDVKIIIKDVFPDEEDVQLLAENINEKMAENGQYVNVIFLDPPAGEYPTALPLAVMNGEIDADLIYFQEIGRAHV